MHWLHLSEAHANQRDRRKQYDKNKSYTLERV